MSKSIVFVLKPGDEVSKVTEGAVVLDVDAHKTLRSFVSFLSSHRGHMISVEGTLKKIEHVSAFRAAIDEGFVSYKDCDGAIQFPFTGKFLFLVDSLKQIPLAIIDRSIIR